MGNYDKLNYNEKRRIKKLWSLGYNNTAIGIIIGRGKTTIRRFLDSDKKSSASSRNLTESEEGRIQYLNSKGYNFQQIAEITNRHRDTIRRNKDRLKLKVIGNNKLSIERWREAYRKTLEEESLGTNNYLERNNRLRSASIGWPERNINQALILYVLGMNGELETPRIIERVVAEKKTRDWKPASMVCRTFYDHVNVIKEEGLVYIRLRGNVPAVYGLTNTAKEQFIVRKDNRINYDRLERILASNE